VIPVIQEIASLQPQYSSRNTDAMKRRGELIRTSLPSTLRVHTGHFAEQIGIPSDDLGVEGRDGIGRKTPAPWVRIHSKELSPSATIGYYLVIHFSIDGTRIFVTVGCSSSRWDSDKGDLIQSSDAEIQERIEWAQHIVTQSRIDRSTFSDTIDIGSPLPLPKSFEKATIYCKTFYVDSLDESEILSIIDQGLVILKPIYEAYSSLSDLKTSDIATIEIESAVNPTKKHSGSRQGYGLNAKERKAVELRAMDITKNYLNEQGYKAKDVSASQSFDYLAINESREVKVEVKGTTSGKADAILMTANEVKLHLNSEEDTAVAIVSGIVFLERGTSPKCTGGTLEYRDPSNIQDWDIEPSAYVVRRKVDS
jgi:hypothetical protein